MDGIPALPAKPNLALRILRFPVTLIVLETVVFVFIGSSLEASGTARRMGLSPAGFFLFVLVGAVVMRGAGAEVVLGLGLQPERRGDVDLPVARGHDLHGAGQGGGDRSDHLAGLGVAQQVRLVEDDEIGGRELVFVDFRERVVVIEARVLGALGGDGLGVVGEAARGHRRPVDHRDHARLDPADRP